MVELFWLLLPVAAWSGWWLASRRPPVSRYDTAKKEYSPSYFKGLNLLLNEQPDKAIEVFTQLLEVDSETVETHIALGNLFRRRGEVDRAIRIHQNLIARPTLSVEQRAQALLELGQDYMRAGLLDRAEHLFRELLNLPGHHAAALRNLVDIYQTEKDWDQAISVARQLMDAGGGDILDQIAHFHCELAEKALKLQDTQGGLLELRKASNAQKNCVRATLIRGRVELELKRYKDAVRTLNLVDQQDAAFFSEALPLLEQCHRQLGSLDSFIDDIMARLQRRPNVLVILSLSRLLAQRDGEEAAANFLTQQLRNHASIQGMERLIRLRMATAEGKARDDLQLLAEIVEKVLEEGASYRCSKCGFSGQQLHWLCPSCHSWGTSRPNPQ